MELSNPLFVLILSPLVVFAFLVLMFRITGRRTQGKVSPFDLITLLLISECVQNSIMREEKSFVGGLICAASLLITNKIFNLLKFKWPWFKTLTEGQSVTLFEDGKINYRNIIKEKLKKEDLVELIREHGLMDLSQVHLIVMETDGTISVISKENKV